MATKLGQKNRWYKFKMMMTFIKVKGQQRSRIVNYPVATKLGQKNRWLKFKIMMTFMKVKGQQRSNIVNFVRWLRNLVWCKLRMMTLMEVKGKQRSNINRSLPYQVSMSLGNYYTLLTTIKGTRGTLLVIVNLYIVDQLLLPFKSYDRDMLGI